jgi:uncharacterized protein YbbC (DUF1343 family)
MQLLEDGKIGLDDRVSKYLPELRSNGKENITVRELLTHYSGLGPDLDTTTEWSGYETAMKKIVDEKPSCIPGSHFIYSDINFEILGELVSRVSGVPLDVYCAEHIFSPLGMKNTFFKPPHSLRGRIAPTQYEKGAKGNIRCGEVHDPTAYRMAGIAGHAGLFSTADDLSIFAKTLLAGGSLHGSRILSAATIEKMISPQSPPDTIPVRGLGWNVGPPFASNRKELFPVGSYGHKGFTGTMVWIDPVSRTYVIVLTNRVHPAGNGDAEPLRRKIIALISDSLGPVSPEKILAQIPSPANFAIRKDFPEPGKGTSKIKPGIDALTEEKFLPLAGLRVGLITNRSAMNSTGMRTIDILLGAPNVRLTALFSPEHGLSVASDKKVPSSSDPVTGLKVYSLYGDSLRPTEKMLEGLDALVFDIQDAGVRFYTYITTMAYAMEAASRKGIPFFVLDRPNPLTGAAVQGPLMDRDLKSFTGYFPLPLRHGMTVGELALMFNAENKIGTDLHVIKMQGYARSYWYDETGLLWVSPSPNLRTLTEAILYPGVAMVEGANVSVGRGTDRPFELLGAPWIKAKELAEYLTKRKVRGVRVEPSDFTPDSARFKNQKCHGVRIFLEDRRLLDPALLGLEIVSALYRLYPEHFEIDKTLSLIGSVSTLKAIKDGEDPQSIISRWGPDLDRFQKLRAGYLLY